MGEVGGSCGSVGEPAATNVGCKVLELILSLEKKKKKVSFVYFWCASYFSSLTSGESGSMDQLGMIQMKSALFLLSSSNYEDKHLFPSALLRQLEPAP